MELNISPNQQLNKLARLDSACLEPENQYQLAAATTANYMDCSIISNRDVGLGISKQTPDFVEAYQEKRIIYQENHYLLQ